MRVFPSAQYSEGPLLAFSSSPLVRGRAGQPWPLLHRGAQACRVLTDGGTDRLPGEWVDAHLPALWEPAAVGELECLPAGGSGKPAHSLPWRTSTGLLPGDLCLGGPMVVTADFLPSLAYNAGEAA